MSRTKPKGKAQVRRVFCLSRTLSVQDVLESSTDRKEELNVEEKAFNT